jgi:hypothetical protein
VNNEQLQTRTDPGKWSRAEVLSHFAEGEMTFGFRIRLIASQTNCAIAGFDQNKWIEHAGYLIQNPATTLQLFKTLRAANLAFLQGLPKEVWDNYGMHSERGKETLHDLVSMTAGHDLNHLKQLEP